MPTYVSLMKLTDMGMLAIREAPQRLADGFKAFESRGGKVIGFYAAMGEYDYVIIGESPTDDLAFSFVLALGAGGMIRTHTMRVFSLDTLVEQIEQLPAPRLET